MNARQTKALLFTLDYVVCLHALYLMGRLNKDTVTSFHALVGTMFLHWVISTIVCGPGFRSLSEFVLMMCAIIVSNMNNLIFIQYYLYSFMATYSVMIVGYLCHSPEISDKTSDPIDDSSPSPTPTVLAATTPPNSPEPLTLPSPFPGVEDVFSNEACSVCDKVDADGSLMICLACQQLTCIECVAKPLTETRWSCMNCMTQRIRDFHGPLTTLRAATHNMKQWITDDVSDDLKEKVEGSSDSSIHSF